MNNVAVRDQKTGPRRIAQCTCCGSVYTRAEWQALPSRRPWPGEGLEIAECKCGSTIAVEVPS